MDPLTDELLLLVLHQLEVHDALRAARVCHRLHALVQGSDCLWKALTEATFLLPYEADLRSPPAEGGDLPWKTLFLTRYRKQRRKEQQRQRLHQLRATERLQAVQRELGKARGALKMELARQERLEAELAALERARQLRAAGDVWAPVAVRKFHSDVIEQTPISSDWRCQQVRGEVALSASHVKQHVNSIKAGKAKLKDARQQLARLQP
eukprot:jgi/Tetstr1/459465/TSEL_004832.t2